MAQFYFSNRLIILERLASMDILDLFLDLSGLQDRCVPGSYGRWGKQWVHRQGDAAAYICKTETRRIIRCKGKAVLNTCCYLFEIR